ncbi:MAG: DNA-binding GntR family transcriptional regulator [Desulforhopalus sp.]
MVVIKKTTYKDQVVEHIYDLVLDGRFSPGEHVKESVLAKEMGISRAPVREALRELISSGIVEYRPQVGNFIALLSPKQIVDSYTTRGVLEGFAVMETQHSFGEDDLEELDLMVERMRKLAVKGERKKVVQVGGEFHDLLTSYNRNVQLAEYNERLSLKLHVLFYKHWSTLYSPDEIGNRHGRIVESLRSAGGVRIEQTIRDHYIETGTKIAALYSDMFVYKASVR